MNLLSNTFDAIKNETQKWVSIVILPEGDFVRVSVTDSGHGISPEVVEKMMNPFYTTKAPGQGTNLGLSISKSIIESHGGNLIYDKKNANTSFVLTLPVKQAAPAQKIAA